jgi:hypothetical protein
VKVGSVRIISGVGEGVAVAVGAARVGIEVAVGALVSLGATVGLGAGVSVGTGEGRAVAAGVGLLVAKLSNVGSGPVGGSTVGGLQAAEATTMSSSSGTIVLLIKGPPNCIRQHSPVGFSEIRSIVSLRFVQKACKRTAKRVLR